MQKTVIGLFTTETSAREAVNTLRNSGYTENEISIVQKGDKKSSGSQRGTDRGMAGGTRGTAMDMSGDNIGDGMTTGATWGGLAGLALGAGALAVPGIGPLVAAGPIAAALTGAATGGIAGGLIDWGIPEERGRHYEERVRQGDLLAIVKVNESKANEAASILRQNDARDVEIHNAK
jgi:hypothetical protein